MNQSKKITFSSLVESHLWKALVVVPAAMIFGQIVTVPIMHWQYEVTLSEILLVAISVVYVLYLLVNYKTKKFEFSYIGGALALLFLFSFLSGFWGESLEKYVIAMRVLMFQVATFFLVINLIKTKQQIMAGLMGLLVPALAASVFAIYSVQSIPYKELLKLNRSLIVTPFGAVSYVAAMMAMFVPIALGLYHLAKHYWLRVVTSLTYVLLWVGLLYAAGKAAILSAGIAVIAMLWRVKEKRLYVLILSLFALTLFFALAVRNQNASYTFGRFTEAGGDTSTQFRLLELNAAKNIFFENPLVGVGTGNLKIAYLHETGFYEGEANNIIVQYATELGIVGLLMLCLLMAYILRLYRGEYILWNKNHPELLALFTSFLLAVGLNGMFEVTLVGLLYGILFWYVIGLMYRLSRLKV